MPIESIKSVIAVMGVPEISKYRLMSGFQCIWTKDPVAV
jgi:hypothetical protein